jgi:hypothetical protein
MLIIPITPMRETTIRSSISEKPRRRVIEGVFMTPPKALSGPLARERSIVM